MDDMMSKMIEDVNSRLNEHAAFLLATKYLKTKVYDDPDGHRVIVEISVKCPHCGKEVKL